MRLITQFFKKRDKEAEKRLREEIEEGGGLEKNDFAAMLLSAYLVILPIALLALGVVALIAWAFLGFS